MTFDARPALASLSARYVFEKTVVAEAALASLSALRTLRVLRC